MNSKPSYDQIKKEHHLDTSTKKLIFFSMTPGFLANKSTMRQL